MTQCYLGVKQMQEFLGLGRNTVLRLCRNHVHGFPAVKVGNRYQADAEKLAQWKDEWFNAKFSI